MSNPNRRALLVGAGGLVAVGAAGGRAVAPLAGQSYSPEFVEYLRCRQAHIDSCEGEPELKGVAYHAWDEANTAACEARHTASIVIRDRPVRSRQNFLELALVVRTELYQQDADGSWHAHSSNEELEDAMHRAVFVVIDGGANV